MEFRKSRRTGKYFVHIEDRPGGKVLLVTPLAEIKTLDPSLFDEPEEQNESEGERGQEPLPSEEMLTAVLKLAGASIENVVYLRQKVEELDEVVKATKEQLDEMQQQLKELRDAWIE